MLRVLISLTVSSALYGFSIGACHSWLYASRNLVKFPLLIVTTASVCALAYFVLARFLAPRLSFCDVQRLVILLFRDTSVMLAGLAPVSLFLALTNRKGNITVVGKIVHCSGLNDGYYRAGVFLEIVPPNHCSVLASILANAG